MNHVWIGALLLALADASACQVTLRQHSEVAGPKIFLKDIAEIECPGDSVLPQLDLGEAGHFGLTRLIDVERLQSLFLSPWDGRLVLVAPARTIQATTASDTLTLNELNVLVDSTFSRESVLPRNIRTLSLVKAPAFIPLPKGPRTVELVFSGLKRKGKVPLELRIGVDLKILRRIPLVVDARIQAPVVVAKGTIRRGERFSDLNITEELRDITSSAPGAELTLQDCLGKLATQTVVSGRRVTTRLVDIQPLFRKGDNVPLVMNEGQVHVAIDAVARRDGRAGEVIPVWNPVNRKMVHALVRQDGTLKLMGEGG